MDYSMWRSVVLLACAVSAVTSQTTQVSQCIYNPGELPIHTVVEGCTTPPCLLPEGQDVIIHMIYRNRYAVTEMRTLVTVYMRLLGLPLPIPYPLGENEETCNFLVNANCPIIQGQLVHYTLRMPFFEEFMAIAGDLEMVTEIRVVDQYYGHMLCVRLPMKYELPISGGVAGPSEAVNEKSAVQP